MSRFLRDRFQTLEPYTPGEQPKTLGRLIKLNTNENPYEPAPGAVGVINSDEAKKLRLYSEPAASLLTEAIADFYGIRQEQVIAGNGSDEILAFIFMASQIEDILENNRDNLVVIDEAYVDFGADSAVGLIDRYDNLLVVQTLSKSRSLAGARVGFAMGSEELIEDLNRIKFSFNPYNLNRLSILAGAEAMKDRGYFETTRKKIIDTREHFVEELKGLGFRVLPSKANFVFAASDRMRGERFFNELRKYDIIVRHFKDEKIADYVRITIGTPEEMELLISATRKILESI